MIKKKLKANRKEKSYKSKLPLSLVAEAESVYFTTRIQTRPPSITLTYPGKKSETDILSPKPSVALKKVSMFGQIRFDESSNQLIEGDNLEVLRCLLADNSIAGRVREIYIDPPYSTNQSYRIGSERTATVSSSDADEVAYVDSLSGANFLEFLRERLILLREILANDGSIYLHIDYKIGHYVKIVMDEVFGPKNFINDITRIKCNPKNFSRKGYGNVKDLILFYSKTRNYVWNEPRIEFTDEDITKLFPRIDKDGRRYTTTPLHAPGETRNGSTGQQWLGLFPPKGRHWRVPPKELSKLERMSLIEWSTTGNPRKKIYADEKLASGKKLQDVWELKDPPFPTYPTEKNIELLKRIISASSNPGDLVLDCFVGSGTTLLAAEQLGRKWIGIDASKAAAKVALRRLQSLKHYNSFSFSQAIDLKGSTKKKNGTYL